MSGNLGPGPDMRRLVLKHRTPPVRSDEKIDGSSRRLLEGRGIAGEVPHICDL